jgi:hypothetical protein
MSKFLRVNGDYKITTDVGGRITLDTGPETGTVYITGDLVVEGESTNLETTDLVIEDNLIVLNKGESGAGITRDGQAGLEVERGTLTNGRWMFVDSVVFTDTANAGTVRSGAWSARDTSGKLLGIETVSITTNGYDLNLLGQYNVNTLGVIDPQPNPGKVTVDGVGSNYHLRVTEDNDIPNKKYVDQEIENFFNSTVPNRIETGIAPSATTKVQVYDDSETSAPSYVAVTVDGYNKVEVYEDYTDIYGLRIETTDVGMEIKTNETSGKDLILGAIGTGNVVVEDNLRIARLGHEGDVPEDDPATPEDGVVIWTNDSNAGGTGLYFVNPKVVTENGDNQRDELVSRNRALVYSMVF